jgi:RNA 3'-terminal phosphate cyclase
MTPTNHTVTNATVIERFLDVSIAMEAESSSVSRITVTARS